MHRAVVIDLFVKITFRVFSKIINTAQGNNSIVPYPEIRYIAFIREFEAAPGPERLVFNTRPKMAGLWISLQFRDGRLAWTGTLVRPSEREAMVQWRSANEGTAGSST